LISLIVVAMGNPDRWSAREIKRPARKLPIRRTP